MSAIRPNGINWKIQFHVGVDFPKLIYRFSSIHNLKEVFTVGTSQADSKFYTEAQGSRTDHRGSYTEGQNRKTDCGTIKGSPYSEGGGVPYSCAHLDKSQ